MANDDGLWAQGSHGLQSAQPPVHGSSPRSRLGCRHHVSADHRRLSVFRGHHRSLFTEGGGLGARRSHRCRVVDSCAPSSPGQARAVTRTGLPQRWRHVMRCQGIPRSVHGIGARPAICECETGFSPPRDPPSRFRFGRHLLLGSNPRLTDQQPKACEPAGEGVISASSCCRHHQSIYFLV